MTAAQTPVRPLDTPPVARPGRHPAIREHLDPITGRRIRQPYRETRDYASAALRFIRGLGRRAARDADSLHYLATVALEAELQLRYAVQQCREVDGLSWADIGQRLDMTRQAAQQRFGARSADTDPAAADLRPAG